MRVLITVMLILTEIMDVFAQNSAGDRAPVAAGRFYPAGKTELLRDIEELFKNSPRNDGNTKVKALIVPHAGYVFSGRTAAAALATIPPAATYKNIFIIGSSHVMSFDGASVYSAGDYITPLGRARVNREIAVKLKSSDRVFDFPPDAHIKEHSIEVQVPLLQYRFSEMPPIVPIIIGTSRKTTIRKIADALRPYFNGDNLFIVSSDFSHYPAYKDAVSIDKATAEAIITGSPDTFLSVLEKNAALEIPGLATSMCGWTSGLTLLYLAEGNTKLEFRLVDYTNSGDSQYGGKDKVVGYNAIELREKGGHSTPQVSGTLSTGMTFTEAERNLLFSIAREAIEARLGIRKLPASDYNGITANLREPYGAFVTLKINGALRGCIGRFISSEPLWEVVRASALSSAFEDPRFTPLTEQEYRKTSIEITVLGPLKKINSIGEIVLGRHGIYIKKDFRAGTMLPQVATENGWTVEEFLGYTSRDKAGIGWDGWKTADIYIYEGLVLEEVK